MSRHIAWQALLAVLGIVLIFVILSQLTSEVPPETTIEVPVAGGTFVEGQLGYWETINPILAPRVVQANPADQELSALVFDGLTTLDETGLISPSLALEWSVSEDGTVYEFGLRHDVAWHDGAPFTAADVAFTVQAMQDPNYQGDPALGELWRNVTVEQLGSHRVRFTLEEPFPSFMYYTTIGILPAHLLSDVRAGELPTHEFSTERPVGTGIFLVESLAPDQVVLAANPTYWGSGSMLDYVEAWFFENWENLTVSYQQGEIHGFRPPGIEERASLDEFDNLRIYSAQSSGLGIIYLNLQSESLPFFQNQEVRQALLYALDRQALIDQALHGLGLVADSPISSISWAHDTTVRQYGFDPERSIGLLDASGWLDTDADRIRDKDGIPLSFTLLSSDDPVLEEMANELARQWLALGVDVETRTAGTDAVIRMVRERSFDAVLTEIGLSADPDPYPLWHSTQAENGQNFSGYQDEEADLILEEGRLTVDPEQRLELYQSFQHLFAERVPSLLIYYPIYTYAVDAQVRNVQLSPLLHSSDRFRNIEHWYVQTEEIVISENEPFDKTGE